MNFLLPKALQEVATWIYIINYMMVTTGITSKEAKPSM